MFKLPSEFVEVQKSNADALNAYGNVLLNAADQMLKLNLAAGRALLAEASDTAVSLAGAKDPRDLAQRAQGLNRPALDKVLGYSRSVCAIVSGLGSETTKIVESQVNATNRRVAEFVDATARNAPAGSEPALAWIKNAVAAGNQGFDVINKATRQAVEATEANLAALTSAAGETIQPGLRRVA